ncbi:MAG: TAT-variant-translocated molybdopterin oxidoreductase [Methylocapsa sp.]|nr:TAT-variant-translocated molybdopterin oxidoreductase [Methylocapsa sp.]
MPPVNGQWRSLKELADDPDFLARAADEFPDLSDALASAPDRRSAIKLISAAIATSGLGGCDWAPWGTLIPAVKIAPNIVPGLPNVYATAHLFDGYAAGITVKHFMGRPIKVEGNPLHPASLGATDPFAQAEVLNFYDPDRAWAITEHDVPVTYQRLQEALLAERTKITESRGAGFRILTGTITSPAVAAQLDAVLSTYPEARWTRWEPVSRANISEGAILAYGQPGEMIPKAGAADVILAIESDLLSSAPGHVRIARDFASRRNPVRTEKMSRVYAIEPVPTLVGAVADHRFIAGPSELRQAVNALAAGILGTPPSSGAPPWVPEIIADLRANRGAALVHAGPDQPPEIHALVFAINEALGGRGRTFELIAPVAHSTPGREISLTGLARELHDGKVSTLLILDSNPVYTAPGSLDFAAALKRTKFSLALTLLPSETGHVAQWAVPMAHSWEEWSDARAYDGTATILQPQALPLYNGISMLTMLALFIDAAPPPALDIVKSSWQSRLGPNFDGAWHDILANGIVPNSASPPANISLRSGAERNAISEIAPQPLSVLFRPDPHLWDGRYANNSWLQELPRPFTKLTWDNPLLIAPERAQDLKVGNGDMVRLSIGETGVTAPAWIMPGQAADTIVALLGFGREHTGLVANGTGFNFYPLTGREGAISLQKAEGHMELASTDHHHLIFGGTGDYARHGTLADFRRDPRLLSATGQVPHLYHWKLAGPAQWGMSVDLNACIGCNACIVACMSENNTPVVGKDEVIQEREMHWLRIDRNYEGSPDHPDIYFQPVLCMHCEQAPCEQVCPVGATVHDQEGLNVQIYNRCIGTRFCSNNCPYKVRRFNFFGYANKEQRPSEARNPDVTVRGRGVMEKCTYCIQRIAEARIAADRENRPVGEVRTACQAACPTQAFTFGNLVDSGSEVVQRKASPLDYALLAGQGTYPRTTYEGRITNPNPAIAGGKE